VPNTPRSQLTARRSRGALAGVVVKGNIDGCIVA
jgi:hypothetical protein